MSKLVITILLTWISSLAISQTTFNISYDRTIDTVQNQSDWAYFNAVLTNPSSVDSVNIRATLLNKNTPFGWAVYLCPSTGCLAYLDTTALILIAPLQVDTFLIKVWTDVMAIGNGNFTMRFENELDSTDFVDTILYINYVPVIVGIEENETKTNYLSQNYPNPFDKTTTINYKLQSLGGEIIVFDMFGRKIKEYSLTEKEGKVIINENLSSGVYFYSLTQQGKIIETKKFIVQSNFNIKP
jgi:type IX secretion system substrate protein